MVWRGSDHWPFHLLPFLPKASCGEPARRRGKTFVGALPGQGRERVSEPLSHPEVSSNVLLPDPAEFVRGNVGMCQGRGYREDRGEILEPSREHQMRKRTSGMHPSIKNESEGIQDDQIPS